MTSKAKNILAIIIALVILIVLILCVVFTGRIPENDPDTVGNTPGNLNNGGYFCESDGRVYFANAYDNYALYSMNPDETDLKKLSGNSVSSINAAGNYLYYYMTSNSQSGSGLGYMNQTAGIYRSRKNGKNTAGLGRLNIVTMQLCGSYLYYETYNSQNGTTLDKIKIDKTEQQTVAKEIINPNCFANGRIYYNGTSGDHYLHALDVRTDRSSVVWQGDLWNPIVEGSYVYYMDISEDYRLCRYNLNEKVVEVLTNERLDMFNVYDNYIYYQVSSADAPALKRMRTDGSSQELVREGIYQNINITSEYVYFNAFNESVPVYRTSTYGPVNVTTFEAAKQAALANMSE